MAGRASPRGGTPSRRPRGGKTPGSKTPGGKTPGNPATPGSKTPGKTPARTPANRPAAAPAAPPLGGTFRLGAIEGATPGKWIDIWRERMPGVALELTPLTIADQRTALTSASVDAALVRRPVDEAGLHVIPLYEEVAVVVCGADSHLTAADELTLADLAGEVVITPRDAPLEVHVPGALAPRFAPPETVGDAIAIAASGVGVVIVPLSLARLHHRKDAAHRPLVDGPLSPVVLAWPSGETSPLVDAFIGIVRGRTANSSR